MNYTYNTNTNLSTAQVNHLAATTTVILLIFALIFAIFFIIVMWKIFKKAGQPGWAAIIPIYNFIVLLKIVGRPLWWILLFLIPFVNIVIEIVIALDLAKSFGKSAVFGIFGLFIFSPIGYIMLAFGSAKYVGSATGSKTTPPTTQPPATPPANVMPPAAPTTPAT